MMTRRSALGLALWAALAPTAGLTADDGLYEDVFDPNSSFVRILSPGARFGSIDGQRVEHFEAGLSDYINVAPGAVAVTMAETAVELSVPEARHYTVVMLDNAEPKIIEDALELSPAKSDVSVYNLTELEGVDLYVPQAQAVALADTSAQDSQSVVLKAPLTLDFELREGDTTLAAVSGVELKRKSGVSFVLTGAPGAYEAVAVPNTYAR